MRSSLGSVSSIAETAYGIMRQTPSCPHLPNVTFPCIAGRCVHQRHVPGERPHLDVADVSYVLSPGVIESVICSQESVALLADTDLVLSDYLDNLYVVLGDTSPVSDTRFLVQFLPDPLEPIYVREVAHHAAPYLETGLYILVGELGVVPRDQSRYRMVQELHGEVAFAHAETRLCHQVCGVMVYVAYPLLGMYLLHYPSNVVLPEPGGDYPAIAEHMEMEREPPHLLLLPPGMEYDHTRCRTVIEHAVPHVLAQPIEPPPGLDHALGKVLRTFRPRPHTGCSDRRYPRRWTWISTGRECFSLSNARSSLISG